TKDVAELFNVLYETMLLMFMQYYAFSKGDDAQRATLRWALKTMMSWVISPLGSLLTELPMGGSDFAGRTAGPGFELYGDFELTTKPKICWKIFSERLELEVKESERLGQLPGVPARVAELLGPAGEVTAYIQSIKSKIDAALPGLGD
ncbi:MAG: hypothetical protein L0Z62_05940, partial [Gemmataceae bacterium]|nr:hypothetical protein [Gemmataceae bacterium]